MDVMSLSSHEVDQMLTLCRDDLSSDEQSLFAQEIKIIDSEYHEHITLCIQESQQVFLNT